MTAKSTLDPSQLKDMREVTLYWKHCLTDLKMQSDDKTIASAMVGVVSNEHDKEWNSGPDTHPAYAHIFELAADLEIPQGDLSGAAPPGSVYAHLLRFWRLHILTIQGRRFNSMSNNYSLSLSFSKIVEPYVR